MMKHRQQKTEPPGPLTQTLSRALSQALSVDERHKPPPYFCGRRCRS